MTGDCANNELISPNTTSCACPGDILTFICNIVGGGTTLWSGTSFMCDNDPDEIILRHTQFSSGTRGSCNDGAIQGESIGVENNCYSSRLLVNVSAGFNGKTVECVYSFQTSTTIGVVTLSVLTGLYNIICTYNGLPVHVFSLIFWLGLTLCLTLCQIKEAGFHTGGWGPWNFPPPSLILPPPRKFRKLCNYIVYNLQHVTTQ